LKLIASCSQAVSTGHGAKKGFVGSLERLLQTVEELGDRVANAGISAAEADLSLLESALKVAFRLPLFCAS